MAKVIKNAVVKTDKASIVEAKKQFVSLSNVEVIKALAKFAKKMIKDIDKISAQQDEMTKEVLAVYRSQLELCQNLAKDQTLTKKEKEKYFDISMEVAFLIRDLEGKYDKRKSKEKKVKVFALGGAIAISAIFVAKAAKDVILAVIRR